MAVLSILKGATRWRGGRRLWLLGVICLALLMLGGCGVFKKKQDGEMTLVQMRFFGSYNDRLIMGYHQKKARGWDVCGLASYDLAKQEVLQVYPSAEGYCMETPAVSYDNEWIAFGYYQQGRDDYLEQIGIMRADGSDWRLLTDTDSYKAHPSFSADGKKLIFLSARSKQRSGRKTMVQSLDAWEVTVDSGELRRLTNISAYGMDAPSYLPDGRFIISADISYSVPIRYDAVFNISEVEEGLAYELADQKGYGRTEVIRLGSGTVVIDGKFHSIQERGDMQRSAAEAYKQRYGNNFIFMLEDKGNLDQGLRRQPHDFSKPLFNMYEKRERAVEGEPYVNPDYRYYAQDASLDLKGEIIVYTGGNLYDKSNVYMYDIVSKKITQLTDGINNEYSLSPRVSADGKYAVYKIRVIGVLYARWDSSKLSELPIGSHHYRLLDLTSLREIELDYQDIASSIKEQLL